MNDRLVLVYVLSPDDKEHLFAISQKLLHAQVDSLPNHRILPDKLTSITLHRHEPEIVQAFKSYLEDGVIRLSNIDHSEALTCAKAWKLAHLLKARGFKNAIMRVLYDAYYSGSQIVPQRFTLDPGTARYFLDGGDSALCEMITHILIRWWHVASVIHFTHFNYTKWEHLWDDYPLLLRDIAFNMHMTEKDRMEDTADPEWFEVW